MPSQQSGSVQIVHHATSLEGVVVKHLSSEHHLFRTVPVQFSTVMHLAGHSEWTMRRGRWSSRPGMVGAKVPGEIFVERSRRGATQMQVVLFDDALIHEARLALDRPVALPQFTVVEGTEPRGRALVALHRVVRDAGATQAERESVLCEGLHALVELTCAPRGTQLGAAAWSKAVGRARALLDERLTESVTLDELAAHARLDKFHLTRAFRDEVGLPPHAYVTHRRIGLAQQLLARGVPQAEVAARVGLYDQSQLHRHFKRIHGLTPGAYVRALSA